MITVLLHKPCVPPLTAGQHNPTKKEKKLIVFYQEMTEHLHHHSDGQACGKIYHVVICLKSHVCTVKKQAWFLKLDNTSWSAQKGNSQKDY